MRDARAPVIGVAPILVCGEICGNPVGINSDSVANDFQCDKTSAGAKFVSETRLRVKDMHIGTRLGGPGSIQTRSAYRAAVLKNVVGVVSKDGIRRNSPGGVEVNSSC